MTDLGTLPGGLGSQAAGINNRGQITRFADPAGHSGRQAVPLWDWLPVRHSVALPRARRRRWQTARSRLHIRGL